MLRFDAVPDSVRNLLSRLSGLACLDSFALAGGTSLALRFGHRWSVDLDFFTTDPFEPEALHPALGLAEAVAVSRSQGSLTLDCVGTKLDFLRHAYPLLAPVETFGELRMLSISDVAAMKLNAIANRGSKKDFFDLYQLLDLHALEELLGFFERKYANSDRFIVLRSLGFFEDAEMEPDPISLRGIGWEEVKQAIRVALRRVR